MSPLDCTTAEVNGQGVALSVPCVIMLMKSVGRGVYADYKHSVRYAFYREKGKFATYSLSFLMANPSPACSNRFFEDSEILCYNGITIMP